MRLATFFSAKEPSFNRFVEAMTMTTETKRILLTYLELLFKEQGCLSIKKSALKSLPAERKRIEPGVEQLRLKRHVTLVK